MTPAEIAEECGLTPAAVRQWISKGELPASRMGMRKLRVRRADLEALLIEWQRQESIRRSRIEEPEETSGSLASPLAAGSHESARELLGFASDSLNRALSASARARPSDGYTERLRAIADGFEHVAATTIHAAKSSGATWKSTTGFGVDRLPYELRPDGNRPPEGLWLDFDQAVETLGAAMAGTDLAAVGEASRAVADALLSVAKRVDVDAAPAAELGRGTARREA
jgi:excisionase family DNA binding protein